MSGRADGGGYRSSLHAPGANSHPPAVQLGALFYLFFSVSFVRQVITPSDEHSSPKRVWWRVVIITLVVEVGTCLLVFYAWGNYPFESVGHKIFTTVFHAVSAFCNAGFSLLDDNLLTVQRAFVLHLVIVIAYGLGGWALIRSTICLRRRDFGSDWPAPKRTGVLPPKCRSTTAIVLVGVGTLLFYGLEQQNTLRELNLTEKLIGSVFQSSTTRTAGFYTVEITQLLGTTSVMMILLMLIGGGAGSTAGGLTTATFYPLLTRWRRDASRPHGGTPWFLVRWVLGYALLINSVGTIALSITESGRSPVDLLFEQVSAFSSVGLSRVVTSTLSTSGQGILVVSMLLGRVGLLGLSMGLSGFGKRQDMQHRRRGRG